MHADDIEDIKTSFGPNVHRGWSIYQGSFPEPLWSAIGPNYEAWPDDEGDWVDNGQKAEGPTRDELILEIDAYISEHE